MQKSVRIVCLGVAAITALAACSSEGEEVEARRPAIAATNVVVSPPELARMISVRHDSLVLPTRGNESFLATLKPGVILVGDRSPEPTSNNPYGFARRVLSISVVGDDHVLATERASLSELFDRVDIGATLSATSNMGAASIRPRDASGPPRMTGGVGFDSTSFYFDTSVHEVATAEASRAIRVQLGVTDAYARFDPTVDVQIHKDANDDVSSVTARMAGSYDAGMKFCGDLSVDASNGARIGNNRLAKELYDQPLGSVTVLAAGIPVVVTARINVEASCSVRASGSARLTGNFRVWGEPSMSFGYDLQRGWFASADIREQMHQEGEVLGELEGSAGVRCGVEPKVGVYLYDAVGLFASLEPAVDLGVTATAVAGTEEDTTTRQCVSISAEIGSKLGLEAEPFGIKVFRSYVEPFKIGPLELVDECNAKDVCTGREDGWYCSELVPEAAIHCKDQMIAGGNGGFQGCGTQYCQPSGPNRTDRAQMNGDEPLCGATKPAPPEKQAIECPAPPAPEGMPQMIGPCTAERYQSGGWFCSPDQPHLAYQCSDGGQTQRDCGTSYCRPYAGDYSSNVGSLQAPCNWTPHSCLNAYEGEGWYCSNVNPSVAIYCDQKPWNTSSDPIRDPLPCGIGHRCVSTGSNSGKAMVDAQGNPRCESIPQ